MSRRLWLVSLVGVLSTLTACGDGNLSAEKVATAAEDALEQERGTRPDISCSEELVQEEGARTRCTLTAADDPTEYDVTVTVTSVEDGTRLGVRVEKPSG